LSGFFAPHLVQNMTLSNKHCEDKIIPIEKINKN
jgi:hypothetical protein